MNCTCYFYGIKSRYDTFNTMNHRFPLFRGLASLMWSAIRRAFASSTARTETDVGSPTSRDVGDHHRGACHVYLAKVRIQKASPGSTEAILVLSSDKVMMTYYDITWLLLN